MRLIDSSTGQELDIEALVATGPAGVRTVLTAFNDALVDIDNIHPHAAFRPEQLDLMSHSVGCCSWTIESNNEADTVVQGGQVLIPRLAGIGRVEVMCLVAAPTGGSYTGAPTVYLRKNKDASAGEMSIAGGWATDTFQRTTTGSFTLDPGDGLSLHVDTTGNGGADTFNRLSAQAFLRIWHTKG